VPITNRFRPIDIKEDVIGLKLSPKALVPAPNPTVLTYPLLHVYPYQP